MKLLPSIASADQLHLYEQMHCLKGSRYLHIDIEDGNFLNNITFGKKTVRALMDQKMFTYDVHLLVNDPFAYIDDLIAWGADSVCFHIEACPYPLELLNRLRKHHVRAGVALNRKTSLTELQYLYDALDYVLLMSAEQDDEGNLFYPMVKQKIKDARSMLPPHIEIWCDGGIREDLLAEMQALQVDCVVLGRTIWQSEQPLKKLRELTMAYGDEEDKKRLCNL